MGKEDRIPQRDSFTLREVAQHYDAEESELKSMVRVGILTPERGPSGVAHIRLSQFWKIPEALEERRKHPQWEWPDIAHEIPRKRPGNK